MKKWLGIFVILSVFVLSIKPTYARFVDSKEKTISSLQLTSPTGDISIDSPKEISFANDSSTTVFNLDISNGTTLTMKTVDISVVSGEWNQYYSFGFETSSISSDNLLYPKNKISVSEEQYKRTIKVTVDNFQIPSKPVPVVMKLSFTSIGGEKIERVVQLTITNRPVNYNKGLKVTGKQNVDFSQSSSDELGPSDSGYGLSNGWTLTNQSSVPLKNITATIDSVIVVSTDRVSPLNAPDTTKVNDENKVTNWRDYFTIDLNWDKTELGYENSDANKAILTINVKRKSKAISYKKVYANVHITAVNGNDSDNTSQFSVDKTINITPILNSEKNRTVAWPVNEQFDSQNIYFTPVYYGSNEKGQARTVFPMARFYRTNKEVTDINSIQPEQFPDGENYHLQKIYSLGDTYINNRGYLTYYAMIYGMNGEEYNDFGRTSSHYRVLKYDFTNNEFYDKFSDGIGTRFAEYMNFIKPDLFINTTYQSYNHKVLDRTLLFPFYKDKSFKVFVTQLNVDFPCVYSYNRSFDYYHPKKMSQGDIVFDTYYVENKIAS